MSAAPFVGGPEEQSPAVEIYRQFRGLIASGQWGVGERLPTVRQTARDMAVAPGTAAKAYKMLERDGLVVTRTAAGTRVAEGAAFLPGPLMRRLREIVAEATDAGIDPTDVVDALRVIVANRAASGDVSAESGRSSERT